MGKIFKNVIKLGLVGFAVGAALSQLLPFLAEGLGMPQAVGPLSNPLWTGGFVAAINGLTALIQPAFDKAMDAPAPEEPKPQVVLMVNAPVREPAPELAQAESLSTDHAAKLAATRSQPAERIR